jgi:hypothetical protein
VVLEQPLTASLDIYGDLKPNYGLKINAANCEVTSVSENTLADGSIESFDVETRRFGHGVGMSQRGAQQMAGTEGLTWTDILRFYYPGMALGNELSAHAPLGAWRAARQPGPRPAAPHAQATPAPLPALTGNEYYARVVLGSKSSTLNVRAEPSTSAAIKGVVEHNARLIVMEDLAGGWAHIKTAEIEGYVSTSYIRRNHDQTVNDLETKPVPLHS